DHRLVRLHGDLSLPQPRSRRCAGDHPRRRAARPRRPLHAGASCGGRGMRAALSRSRRLEPLLLNIACVAVAIFILAPFAWLLDTYRALVLVYLAFTFPFTIYFLSVYFRYLPAEIEEAALLDGCTRLTALLRVVVPCALPGLVAAAAFAFMTPYNEFLFALLL